jgi:nicotinamide N-methyltransferase
VEIVNSTLAPPTTTHLFSFTIPEDTSLMGTRSLGRTTRGPMQSSPLAENRTQAVSSAANDDNARETTWYGVCLTVWNHADPERARRLGLVKKKLYTSAQDILAADESTLMAGTSSISLAAPAQRGSRASDGINMRRRVSGNKSGSETEPTWTDSEYEGTKTPRQALRGSFLSQSLVFSDADGELTNAFQPEVEGMFWIPYALTLGRCRSSCSKERC